jgi:hypothetical protein
MYCFLVDVSQLFSQERLWLFLFRMQCPPLFWVFVLPVRWLKVLYFNQNETLVWYHIRKQFNAFSVSVYISPDDGPMGRNML